MHARMTNLRKSLGRSYRPGKATHRPSGREAAFTAIIADTVQNWHFRPFQSVRFREVSPLSLPLTIPGVLAATAHATPDKIAIENEDGSRLTYGELYNDFRRAGAAFLAHGLNPGDKI